MKRRLPRASRTADALLLLGGAAAALLAAELGLRAAGALLRRDERAVPGARGSVRVLCVGESTTAASYPVDHSWPAQLQALLDAEPGGPRFTVINRGRVGTITPVIAERLPWLLDAERPALVITMMGANDRGGLAPSGLPPPENPLRLVRAWRWARRELKRRSWLAGLDALAREDDASAARRRASACAEAADARLGGVDLSVCAPLLADASQSDPFDARLRLIELHLMTGDWERSERLWREAWADAPEDDALLLQRFVWLVAQRRRAEALAWARRAVARHPQRGIGHYLLFKLAADEGRLDAAALASGETACRLAPGDAGWSADLANAYASLGRWSDADRLMEPLRRRPPERLARTPVRAFGLARVEAHLGRPEAAAAIYRRAAVEEAARRPAVEGVAELLLRAGRRDEAAALFELLEAAGAALFTRGGVPVPRERQTAASYERVGRLLRERGVAWIALQYPLRPLESLRALTAGFPEATLVELREPFLAAARREPAPRLFYDRFGGEFGHATPEGDRLIAEAAAEAVRAAVRR